MAALQLARRVIRESVYRGQRGVLRFTDEPLRTALDVTDAYSMLSQRKRVVLFREGKRVLESGQPGAFVELGVHRGGGLGMLGAQFAQAPENPVHLFDRWGDFPVATAADGDWQKQFTEGNIPALVRESNADLAEEATRALYLERWKVPAGQVNFHRGWFSETLGDYAGPPIVFAHVDADFYESSAEAFAFLDKHLAPEATLILDDWGSWPGVEKAFDEWRERTQRQLDLTTFRSHQAVVRITGQ